MSAEPKDPDIRESRRLTERAEGLIPALTQTLAKGPGQHIRGFSPSFARRGRGARVWDVDGNEFVDWSMGIGPLVLGYGDPSVDEAIRRQLEDGITFSLPHALEVEVAEQVRELVPNAESVRFSKTGADVTSAAVRLARAFTRRNKVLCCGYHGWHDWYIGVTDRHAGVPASVRDATFTFSYNEPDSLAAALDDDTACVILEPVVFEEPRPGFLEQVQSLCRRNGTLLVFDEMWTGFRLALGGAQERFGISPDLATYSKAIANGMPLSVLAGRQDVMALLDRDVFFFTTFGGEALSLAAALACMRKLRAENVPAHLARTGRRIREDYNDLALSLGMGAHTKCSGPDCRTLVTFAPSLAEPLLARSFVQQELLRRGHLWSGTHTVSFSHGQAEADLLLAAYADVLPLLQRAAEAGTLARQLRGEPVEPVFRRTSNFDTRPRRA
jgi:glutamate-1-semialdehyde aminotransferase